MSARPHIELQETDLLRFITAGSVDDGKSTLIGRLLYDSKGIFEDQLEAVAKASERRGRSGVDLSLLTDGLAAEREQGITIDVAYRYFATPKRKFIIADSPGHEQYTRNMVTAASTAQAAIILVDARKGVLTQTRRHTYLANLLGVRHVIFAVNKMDLVGFDEAVFGAIRTELERFAADIGVIDPYFLPISALEGDNVVERLSEGEDRLPWFQGPTLLGLLESLEVARDTTQLPFRFPVQGVVRPTGVAGEGGADLHDFRGYAGRVESGRINVGDTVVALPSGQSSRVINVYTYDGDLGAAIAGQSVTLQLADQIDISRGDLLVKAGDAPKVEREFTATICWLNEAPLDLRRKYWLKHTARSTRAVVGELLEDVDVNTLERHANPAQLLLNGIGRVRIKTQQPLVFDSYTGNRATGSFILIDDATNNTVAAGLIEG